MEMRTGLTLVWPELTEALTSAAEKEPALLPFMGFLGRAVRLTLAVEMVAASAQAEQVHEVAEVADNGT